MGYLYDVICKECQIFNGVSTCNNCGNAICGHPACVTSFPHYNNTEWLVCKDCNTSIEKKIKPYKEKITEEDLAVLGLLMLKCY